MELIEYNTAHDVIISFENGYKISTTCICNFKTYHEAKLMYVFNKKLLIDGIANKYKDKIPKKLYDAMINYKLEVYDE